MTNAAFLRIVKVCLPLVCRRCAVWVAYRKYHRKTKAPLFQFYFPFITIPILVQICAWQANIEKRLFWASRVFAHRHTPQQNRTIIAKKSFSAFW